jgi:hypothetical protein
MAGTVHGLLEVGAKKNANDKDLKFLKIGAIDMVQSKKTLGGRLVTSVVRPL